MKQRPYRHTKGLFIRPIAEETGVVAHHYRGGRQALYLLDDCPDYGRMGGNGLFGRGGPEHIRLYQDAFTFDRKREKIEGAVDRLMDGIISCRAYHHSGHAVSPSTTRLYSTT